MVDLEIEVKYSARGVTHPYRRTEHCDKIHEYKLYTALARKLARIVWSVWYNNRPYEPK
ncbi:hypothetical protein LD85_2568 [Saccharolobus islandicus L.D.8.5]|uniref:Uncharacterized protein n=1 Tax=Saccharolobus islandicus (strain L.D.8.5 / Lassen \|nr:hypothetical protein LD85_2568 [Sulfolobus islandicus L.D.8.5]